MAVVDTLASIGGMDEQLAGGDALGAFCPHARRLYIPGREGGPLSGLRFTVKDLIDVAGVATGGGNPDWLRAQSPASDHARAVGQLIEAGASLLGKTNTDELAFSLTGCNVHYGTPVNPIARDRIPGGSSSGSAVAVAGGIVDFALGTDTGGSVRVPAAYCGIYGIRPSHGRIPLDGVVRFAPSFDTIGWFARNTSVLQRVASVLLGEPRRRDAIDRLVRADDAFALVEPRTAQVCQSMVERVRGLLTRATSVRVCDSTFTEWREVFRTLRSIEVWRNKGPWIREARPMFGPDIERNFQAAARITDADAEKARPLRRAIAARIARLIGPTGVLVLPTTPGPAPLRHAPDAELDVVRDQTQSLTCIAGLAELPQVNIPAGLVGGAPVGLSLIATKGNDEALLALAERLS